jgi:AcrR family transcriptional regulator
MCTVYAHLRTLYTLVDNDRMNLSPRSIQETSGLRAPIIEAARKVLLKEGYKRLSMRRVAEEAGCSTMALYRHFTNKEALTQFLCTELYMSFTERISKQMAAVNGPREQLRVFIAALIDFAASYPDHYSIIFLIRHPDPVVIEEREQLGKEFVKDIQSIVRSLLPSDVSSSLLAARVRQIFCCLHGTAALLISHPKVYGLNRQRVIVECQETIAHLLNMGDGGLRPSDL